PIIAYLNIDVVTFRSVGREFPCSRKQVVALAHPVQGVSRSIDSQTVPGIDNHPNAAFPPKYDRALARSVADGNATWCPMIEIGTVDEMDEAVVPFVLIPEAPTSIIQLQHARIY